MTIIILVDSKFHSAHRSIERAQKELEIIGSGEIVKMKTEDLRNLID